MTTIAWCPPLVKGPDYSLTVPYPDEDTPLLLLLTLAERHVTEALQAHLVSAGFDDHRVVHHNVMAHVTFEGIRLTELAEKAGITKQAMSELVIDLERLGYLMRAADPHDRRAKLIGFTDKGRAAVREAMRAFEHIESVLGERSLRSLRRNLLTILATPFPDTAHPAVGPASDSRARDTHS
jgi:DNA-binding MarR family transcriptional regulator